MNIILLTAFIFTVALTHGDKVPCLERSSSYQYQKFVQRHILREIFDRNSRQAWSSYLRRNGLWCRTNIQSFMEMVNIDEVKRICSSAGRRLATGQGEGNLCMSQSDILQYEVICHNGRLIRVTRPLMKPVIVACNNVNNVCRPVHFERYTNQRISNNPCML